jgi:hypothetical protein
MIQLNIQLDNLRLLLLRKRTDTVTYLLTYPLTQDPITVLRNSDCCGDNNPVEYQMCRSTGKAVEL